MKDRIKQLNAEITRLSAEADEAYKAIQTKSDDGKKAYDGWADELQKWQNMWDDGARKRKELDTLLKAEQVKEGLGEAQEKSERIERYRQAKSVGRQLVESEDFKNIQASREIKGFEVEYKDHFEGAGGTTGPEGGALVWSDRREDPLLKPQRPLSVIDVIPVLPTSSNSIEYIVEGTSVESAAPRAEKAALAESDLRFLRKTAVVKSIGHRFVVTDELFEDAPRLRGMIDVRGGDGVMRSLETQVMSGDGTGDNFEGILTNASTQQRVHAVASNGLGGAGNNAFDTIRYAITDLSLKFYSADIVVINPVLAAKLDTSKDAEGRYLMSFDPVLRRMWGLRVVESKGTIVPNATSIVMDSRMSCTLYDRRVRRVETGLVNDQFNKLQKTIRCTGRFAFAVEYPDGICEITALP